MRKAIIAVIIGSAAGGADIIPMIIQGNNVHEIVSAFLFWVIFSVILSFISVPVNDWLKGLIFAVLLYVPIVVLVASYDMKAILPMTVSAVFLGSLVGFLTGKFCRS